MPQSHDDFRRLQQDILDRTVALLENDPQVLAIVLIGSYARGEQDAFSDIDLLCYLRDEERTGREFLVQQIAALEPTLWHAWLYDLNALYLYENGVRLDVDFGKPSDLAKLPAIASKKVAVYDPDGILQRWLPETYTIPPAEHPQWFAPGEEAFIGWFFWMFRQVLCWAKRGAQQDRRAFEKLTNAIDSLAQIRMRLIEMRLWTLGTKDYLLHADPACARRMALTYPHFDPAEVIHCARLLLAEYETLCPAYCEKGGALYPAHKAAVMHQLMDVFDGLV